VRAVSGCVHVQTAAGHTGITNMQHASERYVCSSLLRDGSIPGVIDPQRQALGVGYSELAQRCLV